MSQTLEELLDLWNTIIFSRSHRACFSYFPHNFPKQITSILHSYFCCIDSGVWTLNRSLCAYYICPEKNLYASFNSMWDHKWNVSKVSSSLGSSNRNAVYSCCIAFWLLFMSWYFHDVFISHQLFTPGSISEPIDFNLTMIKLPWAAASVLHLYAGICL